MTSAVYGQNGCKKKEKVLICRKCQEDNVVVLCPLKQKKVAELCKRKQVKYRTGYCKWELKTIVKVTESESRD